MNRLEELRTAIADNTVPGGSAFGRAAAEVIALTVAPAGPEVDRKALGELTDWLIATKPSMTSVRTVSTIALDAADDGSAAVVAAMEEFIRESEAAIAAVAEHAALIAPGSRVLFHSFSGSLIQVLTRAVRDVPGLTLLFTESRPYRESRRIVAALADSGVPFEGYSDAAVAVAAESADVAIVGVDALFRDGSFANKTGTLPLALACEYTGTPLHAVTEVSKLYPGDPADVDMEQRPAEEMEDDWPLATSKRVTMRNQFFEVTPARLVTSYWTDRGVLAPGELQAIAG